MRNQPNIFRSETGSATVLALMVVVLLTLMGITGIKSSSVELNSATNDHLHKLAFFSAESARTHIMMNDKFYGVQNIDENTPHLFPNDTDDPYDPITAGAVAPFNLGNDQSFNGTVQYIGDATPPRNSGYDTSKFRAHQYTMTCLGNGPRNTSVQIEAGFYRIGL
jgi:hypothetical protein